MADSLIRDRIVPRINDENITQRLLRQRQLSVSQCLEISAAHHIQQMRSPTESRLCAVSSLPDKTAMLDMKIQETYKFCAARHPKGSRSMSGLGLHLRQMRQTESFCSMLSAFEGECTES
ncbi:unnamed protein product [Dicrocoelium dendriticum]|nr:unnamed protein product [Dicrocoelium dendriticum]